MGSRFAARRWSGLAACWVGTAGGERKQWRGVAKAAFPRIEPPHSTPHAWLRLAGLRAPVMCALPLLQDGGCQPHTLSGQGHSAKGSGRLV